MFDLATITRNTGTGRTSLGGVVESWEKLGQRYAHLEELRGQELQIGQQAAGVRPIKVVIRYVDGLSPKDRISVRGRTLEVVSVQETGSRPREAQSVLCRELV